MIRAVATAVFVLALVGACDSSDPSPDPKPSPTVSGAPSILGNLRDYCEIQGLRAMIAEGEVDVSQLPSWIDRTVVKGTPRIIDFRTMPNEGYAARLDRLFASSGLKGVDVDGGFTQRCLRDTTDADVERTQDGPGYRSDGSL